MTPGVAPAGPRVLVLPPGPPDELVAALDTALAGVWELVAPGDDADRAELRRLLADVDVVVADWSGRWPLGPEEAAVAAGRVRLVQQPGVGVDGVDVTAWASAGIPVANAGGTNATAVAEWCLAAVLALLRRLDRADAAVRAGAWPRPASSPPVRELGTLRVGLVGFGPIGAACARLLAPFGCSVGYWSRRRRDPADEHGATYADLDDLVAGSDVLVVVVALTEQTRGLIGAERLARLPAGALVVNAARGAVLDEAALDAALRAGRLDGAALDVFAAEPLPGGSPLRTAPNLLLSPHVAGGTAPARARTMAAAAANVARVMRGELPVSVLDPARV